MSRAIYRLSLASLLLSVLLGASFQSTAGDKWGSTPISGNIEGLSTPAELWSAITPSDSVNIVAGTSRAIYSHDGGNVVCVDRLGSALPFLFAAGEIKPLRCVRVNATNTTSTTLYALY